MAQVGDRPCEFLPSVFPLLVAPADIYYILVFFKIFFLFRKEGRVDSEFRQDMVPVYLVALDFVVHLHSPLDDFRMVGEKRAHFLLAFKVFLLCIPHPVRSVEIGVAVEADEPVVGRTVLLSDKMDIVGGKDFHPCLLCKLEQPLIDGFLPLVKFEGLSRDFSPVQLDFKIVVVPKDLLVPFHSLFCPFHIAGIHQSRNLSGHAGRAADKVGRIFFHYLMGNPRSVVHTLDMSAGDNLHQVLVPVIILRKQDKVIVVFVLRILQLVVVVLRDIDFAAYDRLYPGMFLGELEELLHSVHVAMVRDGDTRHSEFFSTVEQGFNGRKSVSDRVLRMDMKVNE